MVYSLLCFLATAGSQAAPSTTYQDRVGVCVHRAHVEGGGLARVKDLGIGWIRTDLNWESVERKRGEYDFSAYDRMFGEAGRLGLKILIILNYWHPLFDGPRMNTDRARNGFNAFVAKALARYKGRGYHWELWNEPNHVKFWHPAPNPAEYAALALEVQKTFSATAPNETLVGPALAHLDTAFLADIGGAALRGFSAITFHPYRDGAPESVLPELDQLAILRDRLAPDARLMGSEWGYSLTSGAITPQLQADYAARTMLAGMAAGLDRNFWYDLQDDGANPLEREHNFGLYRFDGTPKPSALAIKSLGAALKDHVYAGRFALASSQDFALLFAGARSYRWVVWTSRGRPTQADLPVSAQKANVFQLGQAPRSRESRSSRVSVSLGETPLIVAVEGPDALLAQLAQLPKANPRAVVPVLASAEIKEYLGQVARRFPQATAAVEGQGVARTTGNPSRVREAADTAILPALSASRHEESTIRVTVTNQQGARFSQVWRIRDAAPVTIYPHDPANGAFEVSLVALPGLAGAGTSRASVSGTAIDRPFLFEGNQRPSSLSFGAWQAGQALKSDLRVDLPGQPVWAGSVGTLAIKRFVESDATAFRSVEDVDAGLEHTVSLSVVPPPPGLAVERALKVDYRLGRGRGFFELRPPDGAMQFTKAATSIGIWIHGDGSGHALRARIVDATGQFFQHQLGPVSWKGWRHLVIPVDNSARDRWGGANDGVLHFPARLHSPLLIEPNNGGTGTVYIGGYSVFAVKRS